MSKRTEQSRKHGPHPERHLRLVTSDERVTESGIAALHSSIAAVERSDHPEPALHAVAAASVQHLDKQPAPSFNQRNRRYPK